MSAPSKLQPAEPGTAIQIVDRTPPELAAKEVAMRTASEAFGDDQRAVTLMVGRRLGRREVFSSLSKLLTMSDLEDLRRIKESKEYKGFQLRDERGELLTVYDWPDYCRVVEGRSHQLINNDLDNYNALGAEGFGALRTLGIGPAKMRELRRASLPEADNTALIELAKAGDKDAVLDMAEDLIARHAEEKATAARALDEAREKVSKRDETIAETGKHISELRDSVSKARRDWVRMSPDQQRDKLKIEITKAVTAVEFPISEHNEDGGLHGALRALHEHLVEHGGNEAHWVISQLNELQRQIEMLKLRWSAAV